MSHRDAGHVYTFAVPNVESGRQVFPSAFALNLYTKIWALAFSGAKNEAPRKTFNVPAADAAPSP